mgnify:CR=1 FL=1
MKKTIAVVTVLVFVLVVGILFSGLYTVHETEQMVITRFSKLVDVVNEYGEKNDAGLHWINYSKNLPNIPTGGLAFDDKWNNALYVGMDVGLYYIDNQQEEWTAYGEGLPNVLVRDIELHYRTEQIFIGTHGRGLWKTSTKPSNPIYQYCSGSGQMESQAAHIKRVFVGDIESFSNDDEYLEVLDQYSVIERGRYYPIEVHMSSAEFQDTVLAWIDWNNDFEFQESEALELSAPDEANVVMGMISVPENAEMQMTRLRIRSTQIKEDFYTACGNYPGEVEDYQLLVAASPITYCPVISKNVRNEFIREIEFADMKSRTNGYDYSNYTPYRSANVHKGDTYSIRLLPEIKKDTVTQRWRVWIDYDMNGDFSGTNEMVISEGATEEITGEITIPEEAVYGFTRMRVMMQKGETPTPGVEEMSESGKTAILIKEIQNIIDSNFALNQTKGKRIDSPGIDSNELNFSQDFSYITFVSMLAPSPDWFVAASTNLIENEKWKDKIELKLITYDSGGDDGQELTSKDKDSDPKQNITIFLSLKYGVWHWLFTPDGSKLYCFSSNQN